MIESAIAVVVLTAAAFTLGYITRRNEMATPASIIAKYDAKMAEQKAAAARERTVAVEMARADERAKVEAEFNAVEDHMDQGGFSPSGN